ncbi:voltage-dependent calcium channel type A subunit alpha-1-like [Bradysia coprophila]|uniref:voltage-dependent calcium channel type A subunit alpha-1-like n=1 Tax=Bradysia coprophila TaxID=38358 RepID=UPI00187D79E9|nr:voltage-dependent calcium channel type A subunit alpha-1-like [Bradysia coprophila]XP_037047742.1 voltage-dependent calcium channel type A subunit alpha-1-like [Bradysia coprophila]
MSYERLSADIRDRSMAEDNTQAVNANGDQSKETPKIAKMGKSKGSQEEDPENMPSSLFILSEQNLIRRAARATINSMAFEYSILGTILVNCIVMAMEEHLPCTDKSVFTAKLDKTENYFLVIFSTETFLKIIAQGFILHPGSYMRNVWNSMDFFVVTTGIIAEIMKLTTDGKSGSLNFKALKSIRVLRPLKLISGVPSLQVVMSSILKAMAPLLQIGLLILFAIIIFAIIGLEFYCGVLHKTCYNLEKIDEIYNEGENPVPCSSDFKNDKGGPAGFACVNLTGSTCLQNWDGPNHGITSFDNIVLAMLTVFQCITMEGWTPIMYWMNDAVGSTWNWLYFVPLIVIGSFFMLNLVLGVLSGEFAKEREKVENRMAFLKLRRDQQVEQEFDCYIEWICKAEELILNEERTTEETKKHIIDARRRAKKKKLSKMGKSTDTEEEEEDYAEDDEDKKKKRDRETGKFKGFWLAEKRLRYWIRSTVKTQIFYWFIITLVFLNTACEAVEHYGQPDWLTQFSDYAEFIFLSLFISEMVIKVYAIGLRKHFESAFNRFDFIVITGSIFEVAWSHFKDDTFGLSVLRALRLLRIFKVTSYWSSLRNLVISLLNSMKSIISLLFLLFLFIFIFGLLGMQLFGGKFNFDDETPDAHFNTFSPALLTVFQILTGEDWNEVMYDGIKSQGGIRGYGLYYSLYFIILTLFGNYTLLNVFLAIAVDNLASAQELTAAEEHQKEADKEKQWQELQREIESLKADDPAKVNDLTKQQEAIKPQEKEEEANEEEDENGPKEMLPYSSMFCLSPTNPIRRGAHWIVNMKYFDFFIMFVIALSSIALAAEDPVVEQSKINVFLDKVDVGFTAVFAMEMVLKVIDLGIICHPKSYLRDIWNIMDSVVVICAIVSMILKMIAGEEKSSMSQNLQTMKSLRVLRVLRPLKTIKRIPKLKAVFDCVVNSLKNVVNILVVYLLFNFIFAVIGVKLYNGKFHYCTDESKKSRADCQGNFFSYGDGMLPSSEQRQWKVQTFHYDNVMTAMLTLFVVQSTEGWPVVLKASMDAYQKDTAPVPNYRTEMSIYYIVYFIVFPFFFVNIFVALIIVTFQEQGEAELEDGGVDKNQKSCIDFAINARPTERYIPEDRDTFQYKVWSFVVSPPVENFVMALIVLNTILLMMKFHGQSETYEKVMQFINMAFTGMFTIETILKIIGFRFRKFFQDPWNVFDFITVVGSVAEAIITLMAGEPKLNDPDSEFARLNPYAGWFDKQKITDGDKGLNVGFLRLFRAARLIKLMRQGATIRVLLWTFVQSFKALPYVCLLIAMLFFIYAVVGMQVFGNIEINPDTSITRHNNFQEFGKALMLLFRSSTGEAWPNIMLDCMQNRNCEKGSDKKHGECGSPVSVIYFVSFIFFCSFLMLNLFVAVIMDNFDYLTRDSSILGAHHLDEYIRIWTEFDPSASGKINYREMYDALKTIDPPLGFGKQCPSRLAYKKLIRMNMPVDAEGNVNFTTTLFALIRENLCIHMRPADEMDQADEELRETIKHMWPFQGPKMIDLLVPPKEMLNGENMTVGKIYGGLLILESWRSSRFGKNTSNLPLFGLHNTNNNEVKQDDNQQHLHPDQANLENRRSSFRPPLVRSPRSPSQQGIVDAVSNVVEFVKDEKTYRGRRYLQSRYPKGTSSASTSPDLDRHSRERHRLGHAPYEVSPRAYVQKPRLHRKGTTSSSSSPYTYDSYSNRRNQSSYESYEYDTHVLTGKSRSPSPSQRNGHRRTYGSRNYNGRKLPPTPKQPSTLQVPFQSNLNLPRLDTSPSSLIGAHTQPILQILPHSLNGNNFLYNNHNQHLKYDDIDRELYERERDVDSECGINSPPEKRKWGDGPLSFEEAILLSRPIRSSSVVWDGLKTTVVGYSAQDSVLDDDGWC